MFINFNQFSHFFRSYSKEAAPTRTYGDCTLTVSCGFNLFFWLMLTINSESQSAAWMGPPYRKRRPKRLAGYDGSGEFVWRERGPKRGIFTFAGSGANDGTNVARFHDAEGDADSEEFGWSAIWKLEFLLYEDKKVEISKEGAKFEATNNKNQSHKGIFDNCLRPNHHWSRWEAIFKARWSRSKISAKGRKMAPSAYSSWIICGTKSSFHLWPKISQKIEETVAACDNKILQLRQI
jgi:hypothetical protein